jgi:hypothetical protein
LKKDKILNPNEFFIKFLHKVSAGVKGLKNLWTDTQMLQQKELHYLNLEESSEA